MHKLLLDLVTGMLNHVTSNLRTAKTIPFCTLDFEYDAMSMKLS
jgi:hypothetical protein